MTWVMCKSGIEITNCHEIPANRHMAIAFLTKNGTVNISKEKETLELKKEIVLPEGYQTVSQEEMETVAGGAMRCPIKGDRGHYDSLREFLHNIFNRKK